MTHQRPIDKEFEDADDTGVLVLSGRNLRSFPSVPGELYDVNYVFEADFSKNRFDHIPEEICNFKALVKLNCYYNSIRFIPDDLWMLGNLTELDLSRNFLQQIPHELCRMKLRSLNLSNNRLVSLPLELGRLKQLRHLDLSCNMLPDLPASITQLHSLSHLNLHRNELKELPGDIYKIPLRYLDVSSNCLCRLPTALRAIEGLTTFIVSDNPLESPPTQVCIRGLVHIFKYLESLEKRGSDPHLVSLTSRDESLRRRKERNNKRTSAASIRPLSESTPIQNGRERMDLYNEVANLVHTAFGDESGLKNDPGGMSDQSKEEYRKAAHRLYMSQERQKSKLQKLRSSSPPPPSTHYPSSTQSPTEGQFNTLPKRKGEEEGGGRKKRVPPRGPGRSLPSEQYPRPGSWNSHLRRERSSPVLPSKYSLPDRASVRSEEKGSGEQRSMDDERLKTKQIQRDAVRDFVIRRATQSATELPSMDRTPPKKRPPPLDTTQPRTPPSNSPSLGSSSSIALKAEDSREGSITPTNETPPTEESLEEPHTPKHETKRTHSLDNLLEAQEKAGSAPKTEKVFHSAENLLNPSPPSEPVVKPLPQEKKKKVKKTTFVAETEIINFEELGDDEPYRRRRIPSFEAPSSDSKQKTSPPTPSRISPDGTWPRLASPRKKKEKDVFKFLVKHDPNYTIRRQQLQMNLLLEKNQAVKTTIETLMGVTLSFDIGEWINDSVLLCQLVNKLHPGTIPLIHTSPDGQVLSSAKQTMNIAAFITACRTLHVPEEELCSAGDIIELKDPVRVISCLQRLLDTATN